MRFLRFASFAPISASVVLLFALGGCRRSQHAPPGRSGTPAGNEAKAATSSKATNGGKPVVRLTGIPDENPTELLRKYKPLVDYLERKLGAQVEYVPVTDYGAAVEALRAGKVDFAWLGGFTFVQARRLAGAEPVVMRDIDKTFKSVIIANKASGISKPSDLKGHTFAFGSKSSTSGHLMPRYFLKKVWNIDPERDFKAAPVFTGAHDATVKAVESGKVDAGAVNIEVWKRMIKERKVDLTKVVAIWTTPPFSDYVWAVRKGVPREIVERFRDAFLSLDYGNPKDRRVLDLQGARRFVPASLDDFKPIEKVALEVGLLEDSKGGR